MLQCAFLAQRNLILTENLFDRKDIMKIKVLNLLICLVLFCGCSSLNGESQFTNKAIAPTFVTELYGSTTQTLNISHQNASQISWIGFIQSNDYKYYKVTKVSVGDTVIAQDGVEIDGETYVASSASQIEDIAISSSSDSITDIENGSISVNDSQNLQITIEYAPLLANETEDTSHEAYLIVYYEAPNQGAMRIKLNGYTQGVRDSVCVQDPSAMELIEYQFVEDSFDLYFCGREVAAKNQDNTTKDTADENYHGESTNLASIPVDGTFKIYKANDTTLCLVSQPQPSIPDFVLPIPEGLAPIDSLDITMTEGSTAECTLDSTGVFVCDQDLDLDVLVSVSPLTVTNGTVLESDVATEDCPDFGDISGSGTLDSDEISIIVHGQVLKDANTEEYNIVDSVIVGVLNLIKI